MGDTQPAPEALAIDVRLVNLTEHEIVLDGLQCRATDDGQDGSILPSALQIPQMGEFARVDDAGGRLEDGWLRVPTGRVLLTRLRRSRKVTGLPAPEPGIRYLAPIRREPELRNVMPQDRHELGGNRDDANGPVRPVFQATFFVPAAVSVQCLPTVAWSDAAQGRTFGAPGVTARRGPREVGAQIEGVMSGQGGPP